MIINYLRFKSYAFLEYFCFCSENLGISASKRSSCKNHLFETQINIFIIDRVLAISIMQKFIDKSVYFCWFKAFFKGRHIVPPPYSSYIQKPQTIMVKNFQNYIKANIINRQLQYYMDLYQERGQTSPKKTQKVLYPEIFDFMEGT